MSLPCIACKQAHSTPRAFLLTCCDCSTTWHHVCHTPPVSDQELISMIKAASCVPCLVGEVDGSLSDWSCNNCKGVSAPELEKWTNFASSPTLRTSTVQANHSSYVHAKRSGLTARKTTTSKPQHIYELSDDDEIGVIETQPLAAAAVPSQPNESSNPVLSTYGKTTQHLPSSSSSCHPTRNDSPEIEIIKSLPPVPAIPTQTEAGPRREHSSTVESEVEDIYGEEWVSRDPMPPDNAPDQPTPTPSGGASQRSASMPSAEGDEIRAHVAQGATHLENSIAHGTRQDQENDGSIVWWVYARERAMYESNSTGSTALVRIKRIGRTKVQTRHLQGAHRHPEKVGFAFVLENWIAAQTQESSKD